MRRRDRGHLITLVVIVGLLFGVLSLLAPSSYPRYANLASMAFQMSEVGILALAVGMALLIGGIDLSVVAVANLSAITAAAVMAALDPVTGTGPAAVIAVAAGLGVGAVAGTINGLLVSRLRIHPIVITLGTLTLFTGIGTGLTGGTTVFSPGTLTPLGRGLTAGIPTPFLLFVVIAVALGVLTTRTRWGYRIYMVGSSTRASRFGRLPVERLQVATYVIAGLLSSTAGIVILARTNAANVSFGSSYLLLAILVAVLAGVDPYGGKGRILYIVLSVAATQQLSTGLNLVLGGWDGANFAREFAWGVLLIALLGWNRRTGGLDLRAWLDPRRGTDGGSDGDGGADGPPAAAEARGDEPDRRTDDLSDASDEGPRP